MKRVILILTTSIFALGASLNGMKESGAPASSSSSSSAAAAASNVVVAAPSNAPAQNGFSISKYLNFKTFGLRLAAILQDDNGNEDANGENQESGLTREQLRNIIDAIIDSLYLGRIPLSVQGTNAQVRSNATVNTYFDVRRLKQLLKTLVHHYFEEENTFGLRGAPFLRALHGCLRMDVLQADLGADVRLNESFNTAIAYYEGRAASIDGCLDFARVPMIFGRPLDNFCDIRLLRIITNNFLQNKPVKRSLVIGCFNFNPVLRWLGCAEAEIAELNRGLRGAILLFLDFRTNQQQALTKLCQCLASRMDDEIRLAEAELRQENLNGQNRQ